MTRTRIHDVNLVLAAINLVLVFAIGCGDNIEPGGPPDASVVALPPHEMIPPECLGPDCSGGVGTDAGVDANTDADLATHPPFPTPSPCDTCVGFGCDSVCTDAGVDAP